MPEGTKDRVLLVEDDPQVRQLFADYLEDRYDVTAVETGEEALEAVSDETDVVLLDRRLPGRSGSEVLAELRARRVDCRVAMVTAVKPGLDVVEMGFDDYLVKPVTRSELYNTVDSLLNWGAYDSVVERYFSAARTAAVLEEELERETLDSSDEYAALLDRLDALRAEAADALEATDTVDLDRLPAEFGAPGHREGAAEGK